MLRDATALSFVAAVAVIAIAGFAGASTVRDTVEASQATHFPEPEFMHKSIDRTCMIYGVEDRNIQYWQCSDGCEYIGFWKVDVTKHLVCPKEGKANVQD